MRRRKRLQLSTVDCIIMIVLGLLIGTIFTFGMRYWNAPITQEQAIRVAATYTFHEPDYSTKRGKSLKAVNVSFSDHPQLSIDGACVTGELLDALDALQTGDVLELLLHPNSDSILSIRSGPQELLAFDHAISRLKGEATGFLLLGLFMYAGAAVGAFYLITGKAY
ncbi:MAG: hypothetical protein E7327_12605 [Clostridiales bacterium]|nr:hypothetical protein [Clostridiales bacterium]